MNEPVWIPRELVLALHEELLARFGGKAGVRDDGLLDSALGRPPQRFHSEAAGVFPLAAAYAHGIVRNHPFIDGNKRTGFMAAYVFLGANGWRLQASEEDAVIRTLALAAGEIGEADYAAWLEASCERRDL